MATTTTHNLSDGVPVTVHGPSRAAARVKVYRPAQASNTPVTVAATGVHQPPDYAKTYTLDAGNPVVVIPGASFRDLEIVATANDPVGSDGADIIVTEYFGSAPVDGA